MKIYFFLNMSDFSNCYLVASEETKEAILVDPCKINPTVLARIEDGPYRLTAVLVTHNKSETVEGIKTILRLYDPKIYAADSEVAPTTTVVLRTEGILRLAGLDVDYASIPGHTFDSMVYRIGGVMFTGDVITAGSIAETTGRYAKDTLVQNLRRKILSQGDGLILLPGRGPPTSVEVERRINRDLQ
jgi:glyoxylase-like metal-dependent hydrolase (beta-lactamase superfamily II)